MFFYIRLEFKVWGNDRNMGERGEKVQSRAVEGRGLRRRALCDGRIDGVVRLEQARLTVYVFEV